jgi:hypothetical protein
VGVLVIDCMRMGAEPPSVKSPMCIVFVFSRLYENGLIIVLYNIVFYFIKKQR